MNTCPQCGSETDNPFTAFCSPEHEVAAQGYELTEVELNDLFAGLTAQDYEV